MSIEGLLEVIAVRTSNDYLLQSGPKCGLTRGVIIYVGRRHMPECLN
jgi:hypothetical protein